MRRKAWSPPYLFFLFFRFFFWYSLNASSPIVNEGYHALCDFISYTQAQALNYKSEKIDMCNANYFTQVLNWSVRSSSVSNWNRLSCYHFVLRFIFFYFYVLETMCRLPVYRKFFSGDCLWNAQFFFQFVYPQPIKFWKGMKFVKTMIEIFYKIWSTCLCLKFGENCGGLLNSPQEDLTLEGRENCLVKMKNNLLKAVCV